jgi:Helix-turn-helix domain
LHQSRQKEIPVYLPGERLERGEATLNEAAEALAISRTTIRWLIYTGLLPAQQLCKNAPWIVRHADLSSQEVRHEANYFTDAGYST